MRLLQTITPDTLGLRMEVFRSALTGGCTRGATVRHNTIWVASDELVTCKRGTRPLFRGQGHVTFREAMESNTPCFQIGAAGDRRHALPVLNEGQADVWFMMGGNFLYTSDSRGSSYPIHVHDRTEDAHGRCYAFYGAGDCDVRIKGWERGNAFAQYLDDTLIPDLKVSGHLATAEDFETAARFIRSKLP